ncbi:hypothetical protein D3C85_1426260 [compost metagenome]
MGAESKKVMVCEFDTWLPFPPMVGMGWKDERLNIDINQIDSVQWVQDERDGRFIVKADTIYYGASVAKQFEMDVLNRQTQGWTVTKK